MYRCRGRSCASHSRGRPWGLAASPPARRTSCTRDNRREYDPQYETFKKEVEDRIQSQRQALIDSIKEKVRKRNELVKEAKAQRKAEHDEIVRTLRGWLVTFA